MSVEELPALGKTQSELQIGVNEVAALEDALGRVDPEYDAVDLIEPIDNRTAGPVALKSPTVPSSANRTIHSVRSR